QVTRALGPAAGNWPSGGMLIFIKESSSKRDQFKVPPPGISRTRDSNGRQGSTDGANIRVEARKPHSWQHRPEVGHSHAELRSVIGEIHLVDVDIVVPLLVVAVELEIDDDAIPSGGREVRIFPVEVVSHAIERE